MSAAPKLSKIAAPVADEQMSSVGIATGLSAFEVLAAATDEGFKHICQTDGHHYQEELLVARHMAVDPEEFLHSPIKCVLGSEVMTGWFREYTSSTIKAELLSSLGEYVVAQKANGSLQTSVLNCADEIYTNSVYNAPFVNLYTQVNPGVGRDRSSVFLAEKHIVQMAAARREDRFVLTCRDPFGSLNVESFLRRIKNTHEVGPGQAMHFGSGGAGLGSYIIFNECSSLYIAANSGVATVIACVFPLGMSGLNRQSLSKHVHWAFSGEGAKGS